MTQPGYDAMAQLYSETFPSAYQTPLEGHVVAGFVDLVREGPAEGVVVDVGCGLGHVAADLAGRGLEVIGVEPSLGMLDIARGNYPDLRLIQDDALLGSADLAGERIRALIARFSLIHLPPAEIPGVLARWADLLDPGALVSVAGQSTDTAGAVVEFDHLVARAWRWHPDRLAGALADAGFDEVWRTVSRPDAHNRFPAVHLVARRR
ncbi:class I SAM-dependent methyltransferase [Rhodococcus sp. NPDC059234]|uniref:class I SAM-dependent methyltransferase n=1 Tax=Rhodococcus sp. NPDC059234 TaxID=3346781 RepID=UPI00367242F6